MTDASNMMTKLFRSIKKNPKYKQMIKAGFKPEISLSKDFLTLEIKPETCAKGHAIYIATGMCTDTNCLNEELIGL